MGEKILVTGATGKVGRHLVRGLLGGGHEVKAGTRGPSRARELLGDVVEVVELDYHRAETYDAAVQWADRLFLAPPPFDPQADETVRAFLDWAVASGTRHVTLLSAMGVERKEELGLRKVERQLEDVGVAATLLRPNLFMQNFAPGFLGEEIRRDGTVSLPAGEAGVSFVDVRDVAEVAVRTLTGDDHFGAAYTLTGPRAFSLSATARIISEASGRSVEYRNIEEAEMRGFLEGRGWSRGRVETALGLFGSIREGWRAPVSDAIPRILGREAISFERYAEEYAAAWR